MCFLTPSNSNICTGHLSSFSLFLCFLLSPSIPSLLIWLHLLSLFVRALYHCGNGCEIILMPMTLNLKVFNHLQVELHTHSTCQLKERFPLRLTRVCRLIKTILVGNEVDPVSHSMNYQIKLGYSSSYLFGTCWCL